MYFKGLVNAAEREREGIREGIREGMAAVAGARGRGGSGPKGGAGTVRMVSAEEEGFERMRRSGESGRVRAGSGG